MTSVVRELDSQAFQSLPATVELAASLAADGFAELFDLTPVPAPARMALHQHQ